VLKQLGVKMDPSEMFEDYQATYEETVKRQEIEIRFGKTGIFRKSNILYDATKKCAIMNL
jgi:hypothetical protein